MSSSNDNDRLRPLLETTRLARMPHAWEEYGFAGNLDQKNSFSLLTVAEACFRYRFRLMVIAGLTMAITIAAALLTPKRFEADMQLLMLNARQDSVISPNAGDPSRTESQITDTEINSQAELLRSRDVLNGALDQLGRTQSTEPAREKAIDTLRHSLEIEPVRQSNILNVSYTDRSPRAAKEVLQALASSFVEKELELRRPPRSRELFQQLVDAGSQQLTRAEVRLASFKVLTGIASLSENESILLRQLEGTSTQAAMLSAEIAEARTRAERTRAELAESPARISTLSRSTPNQSAVEALTTKLVDLENQHAALLARYQPGEPNVLEVEQQIATVQAEISRQQASSAMETSTDINPVAQGLQGELAKSRITKSALAARRQMLQAEGSTYKKQLDTLESQTAEYVGLQKSVGEAQQNYDLAVQKRDQAAFDDALDKERILNVAFVAKPSASSFPVAPKPKVYLALGLFSALFLGVGSCLLAELTRSVVCSAPELDAWTGLTTLATLPLDEPLRSKQAPLFQGSLHSRERDSQAVSHGAAVAQQGEA